MSAEEPKDGADGCDECQRLRDEYDGGENWDIHCPEHGMAEALRRFDDLEEDNV